MSSRQSAIETEFAVFCETVQGWLVAAPDLDLDPTLAAAAAFLAGRHCPTEREVAHLANRPADTQVALGASTLLALWAAARAGAL